jgi:adenosyl cobinamide kinase/adenosyl cobinamide phosphate guanylyltransferase
MGDNRFTAEYTEEEKEHFEKYLEQQNAQDYVFVEQITTYLFKL